MSVTNDLVKELGALSYLGVWFVSLISNVFIPVPEEAVILILGYLAAGPRFDGIILLPIIISALLTSDIAMYFFSKRGNKLVSGFYDKVFAKQLEGRSEWIDKHLYKIIFFSRFLIQLRFLGPFFAGQKRVPFRKFFFLDLAALLVYVPMYLMIGFYFRSRIDFILSGIGTVKNIIILILGILVLFALLLYLKKLSLKIKI